ncbi:MAG: AI-2E family transporter [Bacteroidota bacterium]
MSYFESNKLKQIVALAVIILLGGFLFFTVSGFIPAFLGAVIFFIICSPPVLFFMNKLKLNRGLAVAIVMVLSFLVIIIPVFSITYLLVSKVSAMFSESHNFYGEIQNLNTLINAKYGVNILAPENLVKLQTGITNFIPNLLGQTISILADIAIMYFILFYLLYIETSMEKSIVRFLPYTTENAHLFAKELVSQTYSNVIGAPLLAIIQAGFAILGFWIFGLNEPVFWGLMCGFLSFIPFVGSALVWFPAGIILASTGAYWQGIAILIYGAVVIINVDNIFRFILQKKIADIHPLVTVFGVIIGLKWFGIPGIIFGPLLISYFLIMIKIYRAEYGNKNYMSSETAFSNVNSSIDNSSENLKS